MLTYKAKEGIPCSILVVNADGQERFQVGHIASLVLDKQRRNGEPKTLKR
jgi:hypothetical protein